LTAVITLISWEDIGIPVVKAKYLKIYIQNFK